MTTISNSDDTINSSDIIERIQELLLSASETEDGDEDTTTLKFDSPENREEYEVLNELAEQCEDYGDWGYGETLIRASHFTDYVRELINATSDVPAGLPWYISDAIDWDIVARHIDQDYMDVDFGGITYKIRA